MPQSPDQSEAPRRRRGAELEGAILDAAWDELAEVGYQRLTMESVAARAETGKQVLYRRWRNRAELVIAAIRHRTGSIVDPVPDTGTLRGDVIALLKRMARRQYDLGTDAIHGLLAEADTLPPEFFGIMDQALAMIVERAAQRGECTLRGVSPRVIALPATLARYEVFVSDGPVPEDTLTAIVDEIFLPLLSATQRGGAPS